MIFCGHRGLTALLATILLLAGCSTTSQQNVRPTELTPVATRKLVFYVNSQMESALMRQTNAFANQVERLSNGALTVATVSELPDHNTVAQGTCDLAYLRNIQMVQAESSFSTFALPFLYDDPAHMCAALNSEEIMTRLRDRLNEDGIYPLMAVYGGSSSLISERGVLQMPSDFEGRILALRTNSADKLTAFEALGARVLPYQQDSLAPLLGTQAEILSEISGRSAELVQIDTVEVSAEQALGISQDTRPLYLMSPGYLVSPIWLVMNNDTWASLSALERAILLEAAAGLEAGIDEDVQLAEQATVEELEERGVAFFSFERQSIAAALYGENASSVYQLPEAFDRDLYLMLQNYS